MSVHHTVLQVARADRPHRCIFDILFSSNFTHVTLSIVIFTDRTMKRLLPDAAVTVPAATYYPGSTGDLRCPHLHLFLFPLRSSVCLLKNAWKVPPTTKAKQQNQQYRCKYSVSRAILLRAVLFSRTQLTPQMVLILRSSCSNLSTLPAGALI